MTEETNLITGGRICTVTNWIFIFRCVGITFVILDVYDYEITFFFGGFDSIDGVFFVVLVGAWVVAKGGAAGGLVVGDKGDIVGVRVVNGKEDVMLITDTGTIIRIKVADINVLGRSTQGVTLMRTNEGKVVSIETVSPEEQEETE